MCLVRTEDCTEVPSVSTSLFVSDPDSLYVLYVPTLTKNGFYEDHTMLIVTLCTLWQSFPYQFLFQCWGPCDIRPWPTSCHTNTFCHKRHTHGKTPSHTKFSYPCHYWYTLGWSGRNDCKPSIGSSGHTGGKRPGKTCKKLKDLRLIPRSWWSSHGLNKVFILIIVGVSETPLMDIFFKNKFTGKMLNFSVKKGIIDSHRDLNSDTECHHPLTKQTF